VPSYRIGQLNVDASYIADELASLEMEGFIDSYPEFICGTWRTCMLQNASGEARDVRVRDYMGGPQKTTFGRQLAYIDNIIKTCFNLESLRFARLTRLAPGSVVVPHRDYIELASKLVRIHIPLETSSEAYASEEQVIYRMAHGEIWFLDATYTHSVANFSRNSRTHLLLDFAAPSPRDVVIGHIAAPSSLPTDSIVQRRGLSSVDREAFLALSAIIDQANFMDIVSMLIKRYFVAEMNVYEVFDWLKAIAVGSDDPGIIERAEWLREYALKKR
jgi:L-proline cis-4-hydroxylase